MKRIIACVLCIFMVCAFFTGCPLKDNPDGENEKPDINEPAGESAETKDEEEPSDGDNQDTGDDKTAEEEPEPEPGPDFDQADLTESSDISGTFVREDGKADFLFYAESGIWFTEGAHRGMDAETGNVRLKSLSGVINLENGEYVYDDGENRATFSFNEDATAMTVTADEGSFGGADFGGTYYLNPEGEVIYYYDAEKAGYMAAALYASGADENGKFSYEPEKADSESIADFIKTYAELYCAQKAVETEGLEAGVKYYAIDENYLNILINTAFSEKFGTEKFDETDTGIVYEEGIYYIPVYGNVSGEVNFEYSGQTPPLNEGETDYSVTVTSDGKTLFDGTLTVSFMPGGGESVFAISGIRAK